MSIGILNTRPAHQSKNLTTLLKNSGAEVFELPIFEIQPVFFDAQSVVRSDVTIFLSANAVDFFFAEYKNNPSGKIIAIGSATADALKNHDIKDIIIPEKFSSEGILEMPLLQNIAHKKIMIISGENSKSLLPMELKSRGAIVHKIICYRRVEMEYDMQNIFPSLQNKIDLIITTSSETLDALLDLFLTPTYRVWLLEKKLCVISDEMVMTAKNAGFDNIIQADKPTDLAISDAILRRHTHRD